jgi:hypothetical protein
VLRPRRDRHNGGTVLSELLQTTVIAADATSSPLPDKRCRDLQQGCGPHWTLRTRRRFAGVAAADNDQSCRRENHTSNCVMTRVTAELGTQERCTNNGCAKPARIYFDDSKSAIAARMLGSIDTAAGTPA